MTVIIADFTQLAIGPSSSSITSHVPSSAALSNALSKLGENDEIRIM